MHPFEQRGLGKAPFRFIGVEVEDTLYGQKILNRAEYQRTGISITTAPGGSCAYCGQYIVQMFNVQSSDGQRFHVGCDCIAKVGDTGLESKAKKVKSALAKARRERQVEEAEEWITANREALATMPHPSKTSAAAIAHSQAGRTMIDYLNWMWKCSGTAGKLKACRVAKKAIGDKS